MRAVSSLLFGIPPLFSSLASGLAGEIDCSNQGLLAHSTDASPLCVRPQAIIYPKTASDIKQAISFAKEYGMPLSVRGNGTAGTGGSLGEGVIIDMTRYFTQIRQVNIMEHTITVDSGVSIRVLREKLRGWHMEIPILTEAEDESTIGGLVATKSATPSTFHHGTIREWVEALTVVVDSGEEHRIADGITPSGRLLGIYQSIFPILTEHGPIIRAAKPETADDASGYCVWNTSIGPRQLLDELVGSEGTLGIITSVTLRLIPLRTHASTLHIPITTPELLISTLEMAKRHAAERIFLYDAAYRDLVRRYHPQLLPVSAETPYTLMVTFYSNDKEKLHHAIHVFTRALPQEIDVVISENKKDREAIIKPSFSSSLFNAYTGGAHSLITFGDGIIVPLSKYKEALSALDEYLASTGKLYAVTGYAGSGHISVVSAFDKKASSYDRELDEYMQSVSKIVERYHGGLSASGGDGLTRTPFLSYIYNDAARTVFSHIKNAWDPKGILNPLKKIGASAEHIHKYLAR